MAWRERQGFGGGEQSVDSSIVEETFAAAGAYVMGRRMFDAGEVPWGDNPPFRAPVFVVTHRPREVLTKEGGTSFTFVTDGVEQAVELARKASGDPYPYPAGLNDCAAGLRWVIDRRDVLGISTLIVSGESGGGNLTLATVLRAKRDGLLEAHRRGVRECARTSPTPGPRPVPELTSLYENDGYFLEVAMMGALAKVYDPSGEHATDPLAWPLPRDGGRPHRPAAARDLGEPARPAARTRASPTPASSSMHVCLVVSRTVNGTCHAGDMIFAAALPDVHQATIRDIKGFAASL